MKSMRPPVLPGASFSISGSCALTTGGGLPETLEGVQVAHEAVSPDVRRRRLRGLGRVVRRLAREPRQEHLVLGVPVAVARVRAVLAVRVVRERESDRD